MYYTKVFVDNIHYNYISLVIRVISINYIFTTGLWWIKAVCVIHLMLFTYINMQWHSLQKKSIWSD